MSERSGLNNLMIRAYTSAWAYVNEQELDSASQLYITNQYGGGYCGTASFFVARSIVDTWAIDGAQNIRVYNGANLIWEGKISNIGRLQDETTEGIKIEADGAWAAWLMRQGISKPWADNRISDDVWEYKTNTGTYAAAEKCSLDRQNRLRMTPKSVRDTSGNEVGWANNEMAAITITVPTGQTIKRISFNFDFQESTQHYTGALDDAISATLWSVTTSGTGSQDINLATPRQLLRFYLKNTSGITQIPATNGTIYLEVSNLMVYTETDATITPTVVVTDALAISELSADVSRIGSNTLDLAPFVALNGEKWADILTRAIEKGDSSNNRWQCGVDLSDQSSDGKPRLFLEAVPALTDYDYIVDVGADNLLPPLELYQDYRSIVNYVRVQYTDELGVEREVNPLDDATLTDATSVSAYGRQEREEGPLNLRTTSRATAIAAGKAYLAARKDPIWRVNGTINLVGYVLSKGGNIVPTSEIQAGKRIKIGNYLHDLTATSGAGLTFLINHVAYTDTDQDGNPIETAVLSVGKNDSIEILLRKLGA